MPFTGLLKGELWKDAAIQVFFSLGAAMGSLISLARYNKIKNNCHRQALIVCFANYLFSIISGMCVYVLLHSEDRGDQKEYGAEIAFIFYLKGISQLKGPKEAWATLYFVTLYTLGIDSLF